MYWNLYALTCYLGYVIHLTKWGWCVLYPWNSLEITFDTPIWKMDVLCRGNVRLSVCRYIGVFQTFFNMLLNLVYTFNRWHDMWSLSFITIGSLWPSLQPKVGQTCFLQSWPHKSRWILQIWYIGGSLCTLGRNNIFIILPIIFQHFGFFKDFWAFFLHVLRY